MPSDTPRAAVSELIRECSAVSSRLDFFSTHDHRAVVALALERARCDYQRLLGARDLLFMTRCESSFTQIMLDRLLARLIFLEKSLSRTGTRG